MTGHKMSINEFMCTQLKEKNICGFYCENHNCESSLENKKDLVFFLYGRIYCDYCLNNNLA